MDTKGLQKEFINWCKSKNKLPKSEDETKQLFIAFMKEKHPEEYKKAVENQQKQQQAQAQKALHGAKLNYFRTLKNQCAEDEEVVYYKKGGSVTCGCKKKEEGGEVRKASDGTTIIDKFKNRVKDTAEKVLTTASKIGLGIIAKESEQKKPTSSNNKPKKKYMIVGEDIQRGSGNDTTEQEKKDKSAKDYYAGRGDHKKYLEKENKTKKDCGGSKIVKSFKMHCQGGNLNRIFF